MNPISRRIRLAAVAGVTTLLVLAGATASYAVWSVSAAVNSSAAGATVGVSHALSASTLAVTYNGTTTVAVGTVRVTNSSSRSATYSTALTATSASATLRSAVSVEIGTAASCTTTATLTGAVTGTFAAAVTKTGTLAAGAFVDLCVRTSMTAAAISGNASTSLAASIASSVAVGTWSASATPAITFAQSVAAPSVSINSAAYYWLGSTLSTLCLEGKNYGTTSGTEVVQDACTAPTGNAANELFRFVPGNTGAYRIINKAAPTLAIGTDNAGNNRKAQLLSATGALIEWVVVANADSTITLQSSTGNNRCLTIVGSSTTAGVTIESQTCVPGSAAQKFRLTMYQNPTPAAVALSCTSDGSNAYFSWPAPTGYETDVVYRVSIGGVLVSPHARGTGWDPTVQFGNGAITVAAYGSGSKSVLVEQNVSNAGWTTTGTGTIIISATAPNLGCG